MKNLFKLLIAVTLLLQSNYIYADYLCYYLINSEINRTMDEHEVQKNMRNKQLTNLSTETVNESKWSEFKTTSEKIKGRLNGVSLAIQAIPTSASIGREITKIYEYHDLIYDELADAPRWIPLALQGQYEFINKLQLNMRLMAGIVLSYGTINQMEKAERQILLDFATAEMKSLRVQAWYTLSTIRTAKMRARNRQNMLANWVNKDKRIIQDIIRNAQNL